MAIVLTGEDLTTAKVMRIARLREAIELSPEGLQRAAHCREFLDRSLEADERMYGVNTGIGELSEVVLPPEQLRDFQRYLIYSHAAGYGEPLPEEVVRAAWTSRLNLLMKGYSGCRVEIPQKMAEILNAGVTPVVCSRGSVGACGDLSPMAQAALVLLGEGEAFLSRTRAAWAKIGRAHV